MPRFLFFHMLGCGHCQRMQPIWAELRRTYPHGRVSLEDYEISSSKAQGVMSELHEQFTGVPHLVLMMEDGSQYVYRDERSVQALSAFLDRYLNVHVGGGAASWAVRLGIVSKRRKSRKRRSPSPRKSPAKRRRSPRKRSSPRRPLRYRSPRRHVKRT